MKQIYGVNLYIVLQATIQKMFTLGKKLYFQRSNGMTEAIIIALATIVGHCLYDLFFKKGDKK